MGGAAATPTTEAEGLNEAPRNRSEAEVSRSRRVWASGCVSPTGARRDRPSGHPDRAEEGKRGQRSGIGAIQNREGGAASPECSPPARQRRVHRRCLASRMTLSSNRRRQRSELRPHPKEEAMSHALAKVLHRGRKAASNVMAACLASSRGSAPSEAQGRTRALKRAEPRTKTAAGGRPGTNTEKKRRAVGQPL